MDKIKKIDILHIETEINKYIEEWKSTNKTGFLSFEINFLKGGVRDVSVSFNTKIRIK